MADSRTRICVVGSASAVTIVTLLARERVATTAWSCRRQTRLPEILHADISTISTFRGLKGDFRVGSRVCMSEVSNSMPC